MGLAARCALILCLFMLTGGCSLAGRPPAASHGVVPVASPQDDVPSAGQVSAATAAAVPVGSFVQGDGSLIASSDVVRRLAGADYILVGESHTSPCDHRQQARLLRLLTDAGLRPVVGLEMLPTATNPALWRLSAGSLGIDALPDAVDWRTNWGYDFALYRPVFEVIASAGLPVRGLNLPAGLARKAGREGLEGLPPAERALIPSVVMPPSEGQRATLEEVFREHMTMREMRKPGGATSATGAASSTGMPSGTAATAGMPTETVQAAAPAAPEQTMPEAMRRAFDSFMLVQSVWDATMAYEAVRARIDIGGPVYILAGGGHVEYGWGIARRLRGFDPTARIVLVHPWRGDGAPDPAQADIFFRCDAAPPRLGLAFTFDDGRVRIAEVLPGSPAATAGFLPGDVVQTAGGRTVDSPKVLHEAGSAAAASGASIVFTVLRDGASHTITVPGRAGAKP